MAASIAVVFALKDIMIL